MCSVNASGTSIVGTSASGNFVSSSAVGVMRNTPAGPGLVMIPSAIATIKSVMPNECQTIVIAPAAGRVDDARHPERGRTNDHIAGARWQRPKCRHLAVHHQREEHE